MAQLLPMVCETAACSSARHVRRLVKASVRTMAQLLPVVCETTERSIECLKWGHFFHTASRQHHGPAGADDV